jgi:hypothetical protein
MINPNRDNYQYITEMVSKGMGAHTVYEAVGTQPAIGQAFEIVGWIE